MNKTTRALPPALLLPLLAALLTLPFASSAFAQTLLIHEVATNETGADWIELFCVDDGAGGAGMNLAGWNLTNLSSVQKTFGAATIRTGQYAVIQYASDAADETVATDGTLTVHTANSGLTATSDQLALRRPDNSYADAFCWANSAISSTQKNQVQTLINAGQWVDFPPAGAGFEDCADSTTMASGKSYARYQGSPDTNSRNDFAIVTVQTKGRANAPAPVVASLRASGLPVYVVAGTPVAVTVTALDAAGQAVANFPGPVTLALESGSVAPAAAAGPFLSGSFTLDLAFAGTGQTRLVMRAGAVESRSDLFYIVATPPIPTLLVNEVAFNNGGGGIPQDWIELHCAYDGAGGAGADIAGYALKDDGVFLTFARGTVLRSGEYLLVRLGTDATDLAMGVEDGVKTVRSTKAGLTATDEQVVLLDPEGRIVDALAWARHTRPEGQTMAASELADLAALIAAGEWKDSPPSGADATDAVDSNRVLTGNSLARDRFSTDRNDPDDWILSSAPTPGRRNVEAGIADRLAFAATSPLVAFTRRETTVILEARDVFGAAVASGATVIVSSSHAALELSLDGGNTFRAQAAATLRGGTLAVLLRGSNPALATLSATDSAGTLDPASLAVDLRRMPNIVLSEIMYNPPDAKESEAEWLEIANYGEAAYDLAGATLEAGGKTLVFPPGTILPVGRHLVVASLMTGFDERYGDGSGVFGDAPGEDFPVLELKMSLANTAGTVTLRAADGLFATSFRYASAMGGNNDGRSLEKIDPDTIDTGDPALDAFNWKGSAAVGGSPGRANGALQSIVPPLEIVHSFVQQLAASAPKPAVDFSFTPAVELEEATLFYRAKGDAEFRAVPMVFDGAAKWTAEVVGEPYLELLGKTVEYYAYGIGPEASARDPQSGVRTKKVENWLRVPADLPLELTALVNNALRVTLHLRETGAATWTDLPMANVLGTAIWRYRIDPFLLSRNGIEYRITATDGARTSRYPTEREAIALEVIDVVPKLRLVVSQDQAAEGAVFDIALVVDNAAKAKAVQALIAFPKEIFTPVDRDPARPGVQGARGAFLQNGFMSKNNASAADGTLEVEVRSDIAEAAASGTVVTFSLRARTGAAGVHALAFRAATVDGSDRVDAFGASISLAPGSAEATIGPEGGELSGPGDIRIAIPAGALAARVTFKIERIEAGLPALLDPTIGEAFDYGYHITPEIPGLLVPATVTIPWTSAETTGRDERTLAVVRYDAADPVAPRAPARAAAPAFGAGFYRPVSLTARDTGGNRATVATQKFGLFRLAFAPAQAGRVEIPRFLAVPNPFSPNGDGRNDVTFFVYDLTRDAEATLRLYDVRGREVRRLLDGVNQFAGEVKVPWDGTDATGATLPTGVYIAKLAVNDKAKGVARRNTTVAISARMRD